MVTLETSNEILFLVKEDISTKFIILVTKFLPLPPKLILLDKPNKDLLSFSQTKSLPLLKSNDIFFSGTLPIIRYLIQSSKDISDGINLDNRAILLGNNLKEEAKVDMWLDFIFSKIIPITAEIDMQLYGKKKFDIRYFEYALNDLLEILVDINQHLQLKTFLTANHVQLCDIMLTCALFNCYNNVFTQIELNLIPNVIVSKDIIVGKFLCVSISSIITGLLSFGLSIISLNVVQNSIDMFKGDNMVYNLPTILCGIALIIAYGILISGISIAVASKSKTFKEAQSSLTLVMFLSFFPGMICSMISVKTTLMLALVPFLNTALIFNDATGGIFNIVNIAAAFISSIVYIAIVLYIIIKQYKSEKVLFS